MLTSNVNVFRALTELKLRHEDNILEVSGFSMEPLIFKGERVLIEKRPKYKTGDILAVIDMNCNLLLHRLIRKENNRFITKGDNTVNIEKILPENCLGIAVKAFIKPDAYIGDRNIGDVINDTDRPDIIINLHKRFTGRIIAMLSRRMNKKFLKQIPVIKIYRSWERKYIKKLIYAFYRKKT